ncbi:MAG: GNAT family N-acetyltransferase [Planctomycetaceae bacterium]|nr:GNAT family N-acetyltransferase [Planctomycetaceae bacterium]
MPGSSSERERPKQSPLVTSGQFVHRVPLSMGTWRRDWRGDLAVSSANHVLSISGDSTELFALELPDNTLALAFRETPQADSVTHSSPAVGTSKSASTADRKPNNSDCRIALLGEAIQIAREQALSYARMLLTDDQELKADLIAAGFELAGTLNEWKLHPDKRDSSENPAPVNLPTHSAVGVHSQQPHQVFSCAASTLLEQQVAEFTPVGQAAEFGPKTSPSEVTPEVRRAIDPGGQNPAEGILPTDETSAEPLSHAAISSPIAVEIRQVETLLNDCLQHATDLPRVPLPKVPHLIRSWGLTDSTVTIYLAFRSDQPAGILVANFESAPNRSAAPGSAVLEYLGVAQECRRQGIAQSLLSAVRQERRPWVGGHRSGFTVSAFVGSDNAPAIGFYQRCGFQVVQRQSVWIHRL